MDSIGNISVKDALPEFYKKFNLEEDGGIDDTSVKVVIGGFVFYLPNFAARKEVVLFHDIHHIATGYSAFFKGETEISSWELSAGCNHNWFAFLINTYSMMIGLLINPIGIWNAWKRGQSSKTLYFLGMSREQILMLTINDVRRELNLDKEKSVNLFLSAVFFFCMIVLGLAISILSILLIPFVLIYSIIIYFNK